METVATPASRIATLTESVRVLAKNPDVIDEALVEASIAKADATYEGCGAYYIGADLNHPNPYVPRRQSLFIPPWMSTSCVCSADSLAVLIAVASAIALIPPKDIIVERTKAL